MSSHPVMFFQAAALRQRYLDDLAAAVADARINEAQCQWLELLVESIRVARHANVRPQVGRLSTAEGFWETTGACTGLLIGSEQAGDWTMFWYSPLTGLRQFASRKRLVDALSDWLELPPIAPPQWSAEWFASDPFEQLETMLIGGHAECIGRLSEHLLQLPSLRDILGGDDTERFANAVLQPGQAVHERGQAGLEAFWARAGVGQPARRQQAAQALADGYGCALLAARQRGEVSEPEFGQLRSVLPGSTGLASGLTAGTLSLVISGQPVPLAGVLVINLPAAVLVFSAWGGLRRFDTLGEHEAYFSEAASRQELLAAVALAQHALVIGAQAVQLHAQWLGQGHFSRLVDGCIAWQARNLKQGLNKLEAPLSLACSAIDDAQDVRPLLDRTLAVMGGLGRWREVAQLPAPSAQAVLALADEEPGGQQWPDFQARALHQVDAVAALQPGAAACAHETLSRYLALFGTPQLWLRVDDGLPVSLVTVFLQRLSGFSSTSLPGGMQVLEGDPTLRTEQRTTSTVSLQQLDTVLRLAARSFDAALNAQVRRSRTLTLRAHGLQLRPAWLAQGLLAELLRQALAMERRLARLKPGNLSMLEQVLQHPVLADRSGLGQQAAEVYGVTVQYDVRQPAATLHGTFVLQRSTSTLSTLLLWSPLSGLQEFDSDAQLQASMQLNLSDAATRTAWCGLVGEPAGAQLAWALDQPDAPGIVIELVSLEDHFIKHLQAGEVQRQCQSTMSAWQSARARRSPGPAIENQLHAAGGQDTLRAGIDTVAMALELERLSSVLPGWLSSAPVPELDQLAGLLQRYYSAYRPGLDFMKGVPGLHAHAREQVRAALAKDFPGAALDPDFVPVTWIQYTAAPILPGEVPSAIPAATKKITGSLTDYAANRLFAPPDAVLTVDIAGGFEGSSGLDIGYVDRLVRRVDPAASYRVLLELAFSPHDVDYPRRLQRFARQFPARLRLAAALLKLRKLLSADAYALIERVLEMPDGLARQPLAGQQVVVSLLQLVAQEGRAADSASGMYLIGPGTGPGGPWVLLVLMADSLELREYTDVPAILAGLQDDPALAKLALQRLAAHARPVYDHGGFTEPHLPWSTEDSSAVPWSTPQPPSLLIQPLTGNACKHFFETTLALLLAQAREQSVTSTEYDSWAWRFLLSLGTDQLLAFLPGKLGALVAAWQARALVEGAFDAVQRRRWGEAFAQFCAALSTLVSSREVAVAREPTPVEVATVPEPPAVASIQQRLRQFEVHDIAVSDLEKDALLGLYRDPSRNHRYAIVAGKLYRVRAHDVGWRIVLHEVDGPAIHLNPSREWALSQGLKGGGPLLSRFENTMIELSLEEVFIIKASGLPEIRRAYPDHARRISQAHFWACSYLRTGLLNLRREAATGQLPAQTQALLADFFGVNSVDAALADRVGTAMNTLLDALLEPSLAPFSSERFVTGVGLDGYEDIPAFTYSNDTKKRIFFGHRYFNPPKIRLKPPPSGQNSFDQGAHFRTTVLLHELSHITHGTLDIAYIEAVGPYLDLIEDTGRFYSAVKRNVEKCQRSTLSHLTPRDELFLNVTSSDSPRDLNKKDGGALEAVLRLAECKNLEQARDVFLQNPAKRVEIMLANADSVALLVTLLGRKLFGAPPP